MSKSTPICCRRLMIPSGALWGFYFSSSGCLFTSTCTQFYWPQKWLIWRPLSPQKASLWKKCKKLYRKSHMLHANPFFEIMSLNRSHTTSSVTWGTRIQVQQSHNSVLATGVKTTMKGRFTVHFLFPASVQTESLLAASKGRGNTWPYLLFVNGGLSPSTAASV